MLIRYRGGRPHKRIIFNRVPYNFTKENDFTLEITDIKVIDYLFDESQASQFMPLEKHEELAQDVRNDNTDDLNRSIVKT